MEEKIVSLSEQRDILIDELAKTITTMLTSEQDLNAAVDKLGGVILQQKRAFFILLMDDDDIQRRMETDTDRLRGYITTFEEAVAEVGFSAVIDALVRIYPGDERYKELSFSAVIDTLMPSQYGKEFLMDLFLDAFTDPLPAEDLRSNIERAWAGTFVKLDTLESIGAMTDTAAQKRAYVDYKAAAVSQRVTRLLWIAALTNRANREIVNIVKTEYLESLTTVEIKSLAPQLGRDDLALVKTGIDMMIEVGNRLQELEEEGKKLQAKDLQRVLKQSMD